MNVKKPEVKNWKTYIIIVVLAAVGMLAFDTFTAYVSYPSEAHRATARQLGRLDQKALSENEDYEKVVNSDEYQNLLRSQESVYSNRMAIGSGILSLIVGAAIIVATYRYLRRNRLTPKPVGATVLINTIATLLVMFPSIYLSEIITGMEIEPLVMTMLLIAAPFALGFTALITYAVARITEWHYNRSYDGSKQ